MTGHLKPINSDNIDMRHISKQIALLWYCYNEMDYYLFITVKLKTDFFFQNVNIYITRISKMMETYFRIFFSTSEGEGV